MLARGRPLPIVQLADGDESAGEAKRLDCLARELLEREPSLRTSDWFGPLVRPGMGLGPWTILSDHREIALATERYAAFHEYRLAMLAREGDLVVLGSPPNAAFEDYRNNWLGLGTTVSMQVKPMLGVGVQTLAARCISDDAVFQKLSGAAASANELTLVPYISSGHTWLLARKLARCTGKQVYVAASPPALSRLVNDKVWFAQAVEALLGPKALPPAAGVFSAAAMAMKVRELARDSNVIVVKIPDSAGSFGNLVFPAEVFRRRKLNEIKETVITGLREAGWNAKYPLFVQIWETDVWRSPSIQVWVPNKGQGSPVIEGIFEQIVEGEKGKFVGSTASHLPDAVRQRLIAESSQLARLFQRLGYYGRMSLDCIVTGRPGTGLNVRWVECTGRWGGVSIPMTLVNRLTGSWFEHPFVVAQKIGLKMPPRRFKEALELLSDVLFPRSEKPSGVILLGPRAIELGLGYQMIAVSDNEDASKELMQTAIGLLS